MAATLGTDRIPASVDYPEGTLLLETRMHYGKVWQPSVEAVEDLERKWKLVRDANVRFTVNDDGTVNSHVTRERSFWQRLMPSSRRWFCCLAIFYRKRACCCNCCYDCCCDCFCDFRQPINQ